MRRILCLLGIVAVASKLFIADAQSTNELLSSLPVAPAVMELMLPPGATATVDGKDAADQRTFEFSQFNSDRVQRVEVAVKFSDATEAKRTVELEPGRHVRVSVNMTPVDQPTTVLTESPAPMLWADFSPDSRWLATASENHSVVLWDLAAGRAVRSFSGHQDAVQSVVFSRDGQLLLTSSTDTTAALWDVRSGRLIRKFKGHTAGVNSAVFSPDGKKILTGSSDNTAILWDAATGAQIRVFAGHTNEVVGVAFSPDGKTIATASTDRYAMLWNAETGAKLFSMRTGDTVSGIVFSPDGKLVAASNFENDAYLWDAATGKMVGTTRRVNLDLNAIAFAPDGRRFFTAGKDATAKMWDTKTRLMLREFSGHSTDLQSVAASPDGRLLLTTSRDGTVRLWDIATGVELVSLASSNGGKNWAVVAPDGLYDASEPGRRMMGYRFAGKLPGAVIDQFFAQFYHPGLLAEIFRGERPMSSSQLGTSLPPKLKIVSPTVHSLTNEQVIVAVDAVDGGGGISAPQIFDNGARIAVEPEANQDGDTIHYFFKLPLARGANQIRVTAANKDGSWEATPAEMELRSSRPIDRKGRLFVVAVGINDYAEPALKSNHAAGDAKALADLFQHQSATLFNRVDVIPLSGKDATRARIKETLLDVANLSQPQDTVMLILCGRGTMLGDHLYFAPQDLRFGQAGRENDIRAQGFDGDEIAAMLEIAGALNRILILDATDISPASGGKNSSDFSLRAAVERWSRSTGIYAIAACAAAPAQTAGNNSHGLLAGLLLDSAAGNEVAATADSNGSLGVMEWFDAATQRAGALMEKLGLDPQKLQQSTKTKSFPLLVLAK
jgi:WD40 repeat protein